MRTLNTLVLVTLAGAAAATLGCAHGKTVPVGQTTTTSAVVIAPSSYPQARSEGPNLDSRGDSFESSGGSSGLTTRVREVPGQHLFGVRPTTPAGTPR